MINSNNNSEKQFELISAQVPTESVKESSPKLWNLNFLLLWQGQLVSLIGDVIYGIALGFWILQKTGSTALMGTIMAATSLPRILISPFAGVLVDRISRKGMLILTDVIRVSSSF